METVNRDSKQLLLAEGGKFENEPKIRPLADKTGPLTGDLCGSWFESHFRHHNVLGVFPRLCLCRLGRGKWQDPKVAVLSTTNG